MLIILIFFLMFSSLTCKPREKVTEIDFNDTVSLNYPDSRKQPSINICIGSIITPEEGYAYYKRLLNYIGKKLNMEVNLIEKQTYAEVNTLFKNKNVDVGFVCSGPYVKGHDEFGLELFVAPSVDGKTVYYSYIIVAKDSLIERFEDLKGKVFAFADPLSNTGKLIPAYMLQKMGQDTKTFFKEYVYTYSHDDSIKAVAQGIVDGAAVDSLIWEHMHRKNDRYALATKIIKVSEPYGIPPVVVRKGLDKGLKVRLKNILLNMHNEEEGQRILEEMLIDKFTEVDDSLYNGIREIMATANKI